MPTYTFPAYLSSHWETTYESIINSLDSRVATLEGSAAAGWPNHALLSTFSGADSTAKMRTALATLATEPSGTRRTLVIPPGTVLSPGATPFQLADGIKMICGVLGETEFSYNNRVTISSGAINGAFQLKRNGQTNPNGGANQPATSAKTQGVFMGGIGWEGASDSPFFREVTDGANGEILAYSTFDGVSFDGFKDVFWGRMLGVQWFGTCYTNNTVDTPYRLWGSDNKLWLGGAFLDSPNLTDIEHLIIVENLSKSLIGPVFITGDGPTPVRVNGGHFTRFLHLETEAQGVPRATAGAAVWLAGGITLWGGLWAYNVMNNPSSTGRGDNGVIHCTGGLHTFEDVVFGEDGTAATYNHVYASGGRVNLAGFPTVWDHLNSVVGRSLLTAKAGAGTIFQNSSTAL